MVPWADLDRHGGCSYYLHGEGKTADPCPNVTTKTNIQKEESEHGYVDYERETSGRSHPGSPARGEGREARRHHHSGHGQGEAAAGGGRRRRSRPRHR